MHCRVVSLSLSCGQNLVAFAVFSLLSNTLYRDTLKINVFPKSSEYHFDFVIEIWFYFNAADVKYNVFETRF